MTERTFHNQWPFFSRSYQSVRGKRLTVRASKCSKIHKNVALAEIAVGQDDTLAVVDIPSLKLNSFGRIDQIAIHMRRDAAAYESMKPGHRREGSGRLHVNPRETTVQMTRADAVGWTGHSL